MWVALMSGQRSIAAVGWTSAPEGEARADRQARTQKRCMRVIPPVVAVPWACYPGRAGRVENGVWRRLNVRKRGYPAQGSARGVNKASLIADPYSGGAACRSNR